jgi:uncharacterized membrane protein YraQ (UPF0718 family)
LLMSDASVSINAPSVRGPGRYLPPLILVTLGSTGTIFYLSGSLNAAALSNFMVILSSLLIGAVPLVMLGALVAALIGTFVPDSIFQRIAKLPEALQIPAAGIAGFAFPVCECGSVPVARRLVARGLIPSAAVTFMLAAPILNPIVVISTSIAYQGRDVFWAMVLGRLGLGLVAAITVGWVAGGKVRDGFVKPIASDDSLGCGCGDGATQSHCGDDSHGRLVHGRSRWATFFAYFAGDFAYMGRFLIFGAAVAAALQTLLPQSAMTAVANTPIVSLIALMALAFALSLCSESDAFVAASLVQFGVGPQLAFLVFGPMLDAKLAFLYSATFSKGFLRVVLLVVSVVTLVGTLWIEVLVT